MNKFVILISLLLWAAGVGCVAGASAQTYDGLTIPSTGGALGSGHPRLMFANSTVYAAGQAWLAANPQSLPATCDDNHTADCALIAFMHLMQPGTYSAATAITYAIDVMTQASGSAGVSCPVGGGENPANSMHDCSEILILIYDWCYDQMTTTQRSEFVTGANIWFGAYQGGDNGGTIGYTAVLGLDDNIAQSFIRAAYEWGVAGYWEDESICQQNLDTWQTQWTDYKAFVANGTSEGDLGGSIREGLNYGKLVARDFPVMLYSANQLGRNLYTETSYFQQVPYFLIYGTMPAQTYTHQQNVTCWEMFPWSDGHLDCAETDFLEDIGIPETNVADLASIADTYYSSILVGQHLQTWLNTMSTQEPPTAYISAVATPPSPVGYTALPLDYFIPGAGWFWMRKAWDTSSTIVQEMLNSNAEVSHMSTVPGTWAIWRGSRWLSRNTSMYSENLTGWDNTGSFANDTGYVTNGILMNPNNQGCVSGSTCEGSGGQLPEGAYNSEGYSPEPSILALAQVSRLQDAANFSYSAVDTSGTYEFGGYGQGFGVTGSYANPSVQTVVREFVWLRDIETLVIFDRTNALVTGGVAAGSIIRTFMAHCEVAWNLTSANTANCQPGNSQELYLTTLLPTTPTPAYVDTNETTAASNVNGQYRLDVNDTPGTAQSYFLHVLQAGTTSTAALTPTVSLSGGVYTVTVDANHSINFAQGQFSTGGSVTLYGINTAFSTSVEPIAVTNSGPVWNGGTAASTSPFTGIKTVGVVLR
jgi:hypothetical protein